MYLTNLSNKSMRVIYLAIYLLIYLTHLSLSLPLSIYLSIHPSMWINLSLSLSLTSPSPLGLFCLRTTYGATVSFIKPLRSSPFQHRPCVHMSASGQQTLGAKKGQQLRDPTELRIRPRSISPKLA